MHATPSFLPFGRFVIASIIEESYGNWKIAVTHDICGSILYSGKTIWI